MSDCNPLLFLPGLLCDERLWRDQAAALTDAADARIAHVLTPPAESRAIVRAIPGASLHVFGRCGRLPAMEYPARTTALLRGCLADDCALPAGDVTTRPTAQQSAE